MGNKKGLSCDAHRELAARVKRAEELLREIDIKVSRGLGKSSKAARIADRIYHQFADALKNELGEALYRDCPEMDAKERSGLYYGPTADNKVVSFR